MKDIEFLDEPSNTFVFWGDDDALQRLITHLNARGLRVQPPEFIYRVDQTKGYFLECQTAVSREAAEVLIRSFNWLGAGG